MSTKKRILSAILTALASLALVAGTAGAAQAEEDPIREGYVIQVSNAEAAAHHCVAPPNGSQPAGRANFVVIKAKGVSYYCIKNDSPNPQTFAIYQASASMDYVPVRSLYRFGARAIMSFKVVPAEDFEESTPAFPDYIFAYDTAAVRVDNCANVLSLIGSVHVVQSPMVLDGDTTAHLKIAPTKTPTPCTRKAPAVAAFQVKKIS